MTQGAITRFGVNAALALAAIAGISVAGLEDGYATSVAVAPAAVAPQASAPASQTSPVPQAAATPQQKTEAMQHMTMTYSWIKLAVDSSLFASFHFKNMNGFDIKDIVVVCNHFAAGGALLAHDRHVIHATVPADGETEIKNYNMGLFRGVVAKSDCQIKNVYLK